MVVQFWPRLKGINFPVFPTGGRMLNVWLVSSRMGGVAVPA